MVIHAVEDMCNGGVLLLLTVAEHLDTRVLVGRHRLLGRLCPTVKVLDLVD